MYRINLNKIKGTLLLVICLVGVVIADAGQRIQIVDERGKSVPFAAIIWDEGKGVVADTEGYFSLDKIPSASKIKIAAMGYTQVELHIDELKSMKKVVLQSSLSELGEVVVTGNFGPQSAKQSTYMVRTIDQQVIQSRAAMNLQEVLNTELGIRFSQDNALGSSNLEMNGLSGQNVKILIDGVPMVGRQGVNNEINLNQIDVNMIERIEIVEGPMSVIYGADALAGVINIITKNGQGVNSYSITARIQEETAGNEYSPFAGLGTHIRSIGASWRQSEHLSFRGGFTQNNFGGWKGGDEGRQHRWLPKSQNLANASVAFNKGDFELDYSVDFLDETINSLGPENRLEVIDTDFITTRWMHRINGRWELKPTFQLSMQAAYTDFRRETQTWVTNVRTNERSLSRQQGAQAMLNYEGITFRLLANWMLSPTLTLIPGVDINTENGVGDRISENRGIQDYAAFLTGEWKPTKFLQIRPGLRKAYNSAYEAPPLIPSLNAKVALSASWDFRLSYANGFRAPSIRELYFNFFDASHSIRGNPDLVAETSDSYNFSFTHEKTLQRNTFKFALNGFYNDVRNRIGFTIDPEDPRITTMFNIDRFRSQGLMANATLMGAQWSVDIGTSYIGRFNQLTVEQASLPSMLYSPEINTNLTYRLPGPKTQFNLFYKWTGPLPAFQMQLDGQGELRPMEVELAGFHWMDFTINQPLKNGLRINVGVRNALNVVDIESTAMAGSAHGGGPMRPMGVGRSYFLGLTYQLSK
ncbi:TonB-dependent receptor [Mongoliitalea daihaiensis]|uniref:TonB-dependent receptor n=1 Tax=Mongoliitalea daihaiensis TaxID=2782006 RepID=UPI001F312887|nr:TonB-dependent receptor [Mongoliitalea daihaiensis]UJP65647.1 TonB-dependent receptor [Mongoliitalea daihaiensis]